MRALIEATHPDDPCFLKLPHVNAGLFFATFAAGEPSHGGLK